MIVLSQLRVSASSEPAGAELRGAQSLMDEDVGVILVIEFVESH